MDCTIRNWKIEDAQYLTEALNNKAIQDNLRDGLPFPYTIKDAECYIKSMLNSNKERVYSFAIVVDNGVVGNIGMFRKNNIHSQTAEIGYYVSQFYWGKGIATSAVKQICSYVFENTDIIRIFAEPFAENYGSCKVLEKSGFICEGILRKNAIKNGKVVDMKMYALIK